MKRETLAFKAGDKISYPMHGAGVVEAVEDKLFLNEKKEYYALRFFEGDIKVHVPVETAQKAGLRHIITPDECNRVFESFRTPGGDADESANWNRRNREHLEKMKSGDVFEIASVIKSLLRREEKRSLSSSEKKMLGTSMQILVSELALSTDRCGDDVRDTITRCTEDGGSV